MKNKYDILSDMEKKLDVLADAKGALRCGLIWDITGSLKELREMLTAEDEAHRQKIEAMKQMKEAENNGGYPDDQRG